MATLSPGHQRPAPTSYATRSRSTGIPASTLWRRANGKPSLADKAASQQYLTAQEEQALLGYVLRLADNSYPLPVKFLRSLAVVIVRQRSSIFQARDSTLKIRPLGKIWPQGFYQRHLQLRARRLRSINWKRDDRQIEDKVRHWFAMIGRELAYPTVLPENVYNMDETGVLLSVLNAIKVLVGKDDLIKHWGTTVKRTLVTAIECISADGRILHPLISGRRPPIVVPGPLTLPPDGISPAPRQTRDRAGGRPRLLICDGFVTHESLEVLKFCFANRIILCRLPSHTSHKLQPCDVGVFSPLKTAYRAQVEQACRAGVNNIGNPYFTYLYDRARAEAFTPRNIRSAWSRSGLFPFDPSRVLRDIQVSRPGIQTTIPVEHPTESSNLYRLYTGPRRRYSACTRNVFPSSDSHPWAWTTDFKEKLDAVIDSRTVQMVIDYDRSSGNFITDIDGNTYLDVYAQIASIPVGYNNPALKKAAQSPEIVSALVNRPAVGNFPSNHWLPLLDGWMRVAPPGCTQVFPAQSGSEANDLAFKATFMAYRRKQRAGNPWSQQDEQTCMKNQAPGSPDLAILSFRNSFHGRSFGSLSTTRSKPVHKLDIPSFRWPQATFPQLRYPLYAHTKENEDEEKHCLQEVESIISSWHCPVAGIIVEPIQSEGGDNHASASFFQKLQAITMAHGIVFIVDEVQTGFGATGKFWAHEHWQLPSPVDIVTFSKKAQTAGYFSNNQLRPDKAYRQFNTWMGDAARIIICNAVIDEIISKNLVGETTQVGAILYDRLNILASKYHRLIQNLRGKGKAKFIAFDTPDSSTLLKKMCERGVNIGSCGVQTIRLCPMLIFEESHIDILLAAFEAALSQLE